MRTLALAAVIALLPVAGRADDEDPDMKKALDSVVGVLLAPDLMGGASDFGAVYEVCGEDCSYFAWGECRNVGSKERLDCRVVILDDKKKKTVIEAPDVNHKGTDAAEKKLRARLKNQPYKPAWFEAYSFPHDDITGPGKPKSSWDGKKGVLTVGAVKIAWDAASSTLTVDGARKVKVPKLKKELGTTSAEIWTHLDDDGQWTWGVGLFRLHTENAEKTQSEDIVVPLP